MHFWGCGEGGAPACSQAARPGFGAGGSGERERRSAAWWRSRRDAARRCWGCCLAAPITPGCAVPTEPVAAVGEEDDALLHQAGRRWLLPQPEGGLREDGLRLEEELHQPGGDGAMEGQGPLPAPPPDGSPFTVACRSPSPPRTGGTTSSSSR